MEHLPPPSPPEDIGTRPAAALSSNLAAVDLGSNSFRMVIARRVKDELRLIDRLREGVRLAECLDSNQNLTWEGIERGVRCLRKFGQRLRDFPRGNVRAVGTNTLRKAKNGETFLAAAEEALGHPIEIVSGQEEARLIFLGVSHSLPASLGRRLVVDIGGGSTECIVGEAFEPRRAESLYMGCVGFTLNHFPKGKITPNRMLKAEVAARLEMRPIKTAFKDLGWNQAVGASGTILAITEILQLNGWSDRGITTEGLARLREEILQHRHVDQLHLKGLRRERAKVLPGGVAILTAVFDSLGVQVMTVSSGALREGVLYDLLGRIRHEDVRDRTIQRFVEQYHVDLAQAQRVEATVVRCFDQVEKAWKLRSPEDKLLLSWASRLHEIGLAIAHGAFHKHSAYLIDFSDMPGFSRQDQRTLSLLVRGVRRKFPRQLFLELPALQARQTMRLCCLVRLAVLLNRSRTGRPLPPFELRAKGKTLSLSLPKTWLGQHPLTRADLQQEAEFLKAPGFKLKVTASE